MPERNSLEKQGVVTLPLAKEICEAIKTVETWSTSEVPFVRTPANADLEDAYDEIAQALISYDHLAEPRERVIATQDHVFREIGKRSGFMGRLKVAQRLLTVGWETAPLPVADLSPELRGRVIGVIIEGLQMRVTGDIGRKKGINLLRTLDEVTARSLAYVGSANVSQSEARIGDSYLTTGDVDLLLGEVAKLEQSGTVLSGKERRILDRINARSDRLKSKREEIDRGAGQLFSKVKR